MSNARQLAALAVQQTAFKNKLINGAFDVWQRGLSFNGNYAAQGNSYYAADRWQMFRAGGAAGATFARNIWNGTDFNQTAKLQRDQGTSGLGTLNLATSLETSDVIALRGKPVTLSFKYYLGTNFSGSAVIVGANYGTGTDGNMATGFTNATSVPGSGISAAGALGVLQSASVTFTIPTNATQFGINFGYAPTGTAGANDYFEVSNVQLELGSVATAFERRPYPVELLLCQRYYEKTFFRIDTMTAGAGFFGSTVIAFKATKRTVPALSKQNENLTNTTFNSWQVDLNVAVPIYNTTASAGSVTCNMVADAEL